jgi:DNA-directed RNA polymerase subunit RPC12/RpoP
VTYRFDRTAMQRGRAIGVHFVACSAAGAPPLRTCPAHAWYDCDDCNRPVCEGHLTVLGKDHHRCNACSAALLATLSDYRVSCAGCGKLIPAGEASTRREIVEGLQRRLPGLWCQACA